MSVAYRSTCRPTIGKSLSVDVSANISVECRSTHRPMLDRYVGLYFDRHISVDISVDISTDSRPICRSTYRRTAYVLWAVCLRYLRWQTTSRSNPKLPVIQILTSSIVHRVHNIYLSVDKQGIKQSSTLWK